MFTIVPAVPFQPDFEETVFSEFFGKIPAKCELILPVLTDLRHATSVYNGVKLQNFFLGNTQEFSKPSAHVEIFRNVQKKLFIQNFPGWAQKAISLMWNFLGI